MLRAQHLTAAAMAALCASGCAHEMELRSTPPSISRASAYATFFLLPGNSSGGSDVDRRLNAEIERALADKGLVETSPKDAEAVLVVHTATRDKRSRDAFYQGWGGWAWEIPDTTVPGHNRHVCGRFGGRRHV